MFLFTLSFWFWTGVILLGLWLAFYVLRAILNAATTDSAALTKPCLTCKQPNRLTAADSKRGRQCEECNRIGDALDIKQRFG